MVNREATALLKRLAGQFPVVFITGPRQSGKTTLARSQFSHLPYLSLENLDTANRAQEDPRGFLAALSAGAILDEIQRVPSLLSYLQQIVDENPRPGRFILTGSEQFGLRQAASQSLAGRAGQLELLPFSLSEIASAWPLGSLDDTLWRGAYPPIHDRGLDADLWLDNYIVTYLERDVRRIENIRDLASFRRFLILSAGRTGQLLNLSQFAADCGVSHNTIKAWVSVLEASYLVRLVQPWHRNFNKRLVKTPKLYFLDTGLVCRLLGIQSSGQLAVHPLRGAVFETLVFGELAKRQAHRRDPRSVWFWRDHSGHEVDFLLDDGNTHEAIEVKAGATFHPEFVANLDKLADIIGPSLLHRSLVYGGSESFGFKKCQVVAWPSCVG